MDKTRTKQMENLCIRVTKIHSLILPAHWYHSPGKDNPADLISKGAFVENIISCTLWLNGPPWCSKHSASRLQYDVATALSITDELLSDSGSVTCLSAEISTVGIDFCRWGHFTKALNCFAWVLKFANNCKPRAVKCTGPLSYKELEDANFVCSKR